MAAIEPQVQQKSSDNRIKAIIAMNLCAFGAASQSVFFKLAIAEGARVFDYQLFRGLAVITCAAI